MAKSLINAILLNGYACLDKQLHGKIIGISLVIYHTVYAAVYYHFGTNDARLMSAI